MIRPRQVAGIGATMGCAASGSGTARIRRLLGSVMMTS